MIGKNAKQCVIELDGMAYDWTGDQLQPIASPFGLQREGPKWVISDLGKSVSKTMTLESPLRYVEVIARKNMEESGEFDEPVSIIAHWKKKADANTANVFFTALPVRHRQQYFAKATEQPDSVLVFPLYGILHGVLKRMNHGEPTAVVFQHDRFVDVVIGTKDTVYYANRCVAFDTSEEQISVVWDMVKTDIEAVEVDNKIRVEGIILLNWIDGPLKPKRAEDIGKDLISVGEETVTVDGRIHHSSFLRAIRMQRSLWSPSAVYEKLMYYCQQLLPGLNAALIMALLFCAAGYIWFDRKTDALANECSALQRDIRALSKETSLENVPYEGVLSFVKDLEQCRSLPAFKTIVNHLSDALTQTMSLEILKADYGVNKVDIEVFGRAKASFDQAYKGYQRFITFLDKNGYTISESAFDTTLGESTFLVKLTKNI